MSAGSFISTASVRWQMVLTRRQDMTFLTVRGPQTSPTPMDFPPEMEWFGIVFRLGTFMPHLPPGQLSNGRDVNLPEATSQSFWLHGSAWQFPSFDNADEFVRRLEREGLIARDQLVLDAAAQELSVRSVQSRFRHATGLTRSTVRQIERAHLAAALLEQGKPVLDVVHEAAYFDQPHMTRSLKRFLGLTPAQIARGDSDMDALAHLYKTSLEALS
jgi:AraC-like DNA-binding protein